MAGPVTQPKVGAKLASAPSEPPAMLDLNESQLPQIKQWKIGGKYKLVVEVEQVNAGKGYDGQGPHRATFKVLSAKSAGESKDAPGAPPVQPSRNDKISRLNIKAKES